MGVGTYMRHQITTCLLHMVHAALPPDTYRSIMEMAEAQDITVGEWVRDQLIDIVADARSTRGSGIRKCPPLTGWAVHVILRVPAQITPQAACLASAPPKNSASLSTRTDQHLRNKNPR